MSAMHAHVSDARVRIDDSIVLFNTCKHAGAGIACQANACQLSHGEQMRMEVFSGGPDAR